MLATAGLKPALRALDTECNADTPQTRQSCTSMGLVLQVFVVLSSHVILRASGRQDTLPWEEQIGNGGGDEHTLAA